MRVKLLALCAVVGIALSACSEDGSEPESLSVSPSGNVTANGPVAFTATVTGGGTVTWALTGPGSLSGTEGRHVTYRPPSPAGAGGTASLRAAAGPNAVTVQIAYGPEVLTKRTMPGLSAEVTVAYDAFDVPHVYCAIDVDCYMVQGYLHARDRLFEADFFRRVARGKLSELVGPLGLEQDVQLRTLFTLRDGSRVEDALAATLEADPTTLERVEAFVAGVNARLDELTDADLPGEYLQLPVPVHAADLPAWTVKDVMALARLQQFQLSESLFAETDNALFALAYGPGAPLYGAGDKLTTWIRAQQPTHARYYTLVEPGQAPTFGLAPGPGTPALAALAPWAGGLAALGARVGALHEALRLQAGEVGSNNWVVGGTFAESTHAMVANDPHLSLPYPPNFYLSAMTSARASDNLDLTGGAFPGAPGAQVGRGRNVGWGVTVVGYDVTDLYREQFLPANVCGALGPYCVLYKGVPTGLVISPQAYWVRRPGDGSLQLATDAAAWGGTALLSAQESAVVVVPHHGPVVQAPDEAGHAISVRWTGQEGWTNDLRAFLRLGTATSVDDAMEAVRDWSTGAQNFVFADDQGHIGYFPHALVPIRDFADIRVVGGAVQPPWFPLPGDGTAEWGHAADLAECSSAAAPRKCFLPDAELPQGKDPAWGFFITANSDPRGVSHDNNPLGHPPYLSFDWDEIGFRQARITERLAAYTQGGGKISQAEMESVQGDHYSLLGWNFHQILMNPAFDAAEEDSPAFAAARAMLDDWSKSAKPFDCPTGLTGHDPAASPDDPDPVNSANSAACLLFHHFVRDLAVRVFADDLAVAGLEVNSGKALKGLLYMLETNPAQTTFCDDVDALGTVVAEHSCAEQAVISLATAWETLSATTGPTSAWRWGRVHTFTASSNFPTVTTGYTAGPFARPGGAVTVDVGNFPLTLGPSFAFSSSANVRHVSVMDPAEPICRMQLPGPERDGPYGVLEGPDLIGMWVDNTYFDYANWTQVQARAVSTQDFAP